MLAARAYCALYMRQRDELRVRREQYEANHKARSKGYDMLLCMWAYYERG